MGYFNPGTKPGTHPDIIRYGEYLRAQGRSEATVQNHMGYCRSFVSAVSHLDHDWHPRQITRETIMEFGRSLVRRGCRRSTVQSEVGGAIGWVRWLADQRKLDDVHFLERCAVKDIISAVMPNFR